MALFKLLPLGRFHFDILALHRFVFLVFFKHVQPFFQRRNSAFSGYNFTSQFIILCVHGIHFFMKLLHGGDAVCGKQIIKRRLFSQLPKRFITGSRLVAHRLLCLPQLQ